MNIKLLVGLVIVAAVLVGAYLLFLAPTSVLNNGAYAPQPSGLQSPSSGGLQTSSGTLLVEIRGFAFISPTARVSPGTKVIWKNYDDATHSVVGANFKSGPLQKGQSFAYTFSQPGDYFYSCGIHPNMKGEVVVR